jgi:ubiquinone/menaquinone biosynthesis C-methylase UbiE
MKKIILLPVGICNGLSNGLCNGLCIGLCVGLCVSMLLPLFLPAAHSESREVWQSPEKVMDAVGIKPGMVIGEPGAGHGFYTIRLAGRVGPNGKIYANDILQDRLNTIERKAMEAGLSNIVTIKGETANPLFPEGKLDMVFMSYVLHDLEKPVAFLKNLKPSLKPKAPLVVLEQSPEKTGDKSGHFWLKEKILRTVRAAGFKLARIEIFLKKDNIYIFYME